jgi:hypothetical protein
VGGRIHVYIQHDDTPKPLIILLQGSGCLPLFTISENGTHHETTLFQDAIRSQANRVHVALIEKRGVEPLRFAPGMSEQAQRAAFQAVMDGKCSDAYYAQETKAARVSDVIAVVKALAPETWTREILIAGHSEGSHVVSGVLRNAADLQLRAAAMLSSARGNFFFGGYVSEKAGDREAFARMFDLMQRLRAASDDQQYAGHPGRRWKSYVLDSSQLDDVRESTVPLYVAHGGAEADILSVDHFVLEALRQQPTRPLQYVMVEGADHGFEANGQPYISRVMADFIEWGLTAKPQTEVLVMR